MDTNDLELMLSATAESQTLDFKEDCEWSTKTFAKDILAFSNVQDGGYLIIGVLDKTFKRVGVCPANLKSYDIDKMKDQMTGFADPHVQFEVFFPEDIKGVQFVVIKIYPFREIPVICSRNDQNAGVYLGKIYFRNSNRRVESAPVSNSYDMRDIIERATIKMMQKNRSLGLNISESEKNKLDKELGGL